MIMVVVAMMICKTMMKVVAVPVENMMMLKR